MWIWLLMLISARGNGLPSQGDAVADEGDLADAPADPPLSTSGSDPDHAPPDDSTTHEPSEQAPHGATVEPSPSKPKDLAIFPGFAREELAHSVGVTLKAMKRCLAQGYVHKEPFDRPTTVPYVGASVIDGQPVTMLQRELNVRCNNKPLRRCTAIHVWDPQHYEISYSSVQCNGSYDAPYAYYLVTAVRDVKKAHKPHKRDTPKDKAIVASSVSFQTTEFPGTHVVAYSETRRRDDLEIAPPSVARFDDYQAIYSDEDDSPLSSEQIHELARSTSHMVCVATGACR